MRVRRRAVVAAAALLVAIAATYIVSESRWRAEVRSCSTPVSSEDSVRLLFDHPATKADSVRWIAACEEAHRRRFTPINP